MLGFKCFVFLCMAASMSAKSVPVRIVYGRDVKPVFKDTSFRGKIEEAQVLIRNGINNIRENLNKYAANSKLPEVDEEQWKILNKTVENHLARLRERTAARNSISQQDAMWQTFVTDFQSLSGSFIQNVTKKQQSKPNRKGETIIIVVLEKGFDNIVKGLQDLQKYTNNDDTARAQQGPKTIFSWIGSQNTQSLSSSNEVNPNKNQRPLQALAGHIGEAFSNFGPFRPQADDGAAEHSVNGTTVAPVETTTSPRPLQLLASQLGQAFISNIIPPVPIDDDDDDDEFEAADQSVVDETPSSSQRPLQAIAGQISQAIQQFNSYVFRPPVDEDDEEESDAEETPVQVPVKRPQRPQTTKKPQNPTIAANEIATQSSVINEIISTPGSNIIKNETIPIQSTEQTEDAEPALQQSIPDVIVKDDATPPQTDDVPSEGDVSPPPKAQSSTRKPLPPPPPPSSLKKKKTPRYLVD